MDKKTKFLMNTDCEKDYKKNHCWEKLGVIMYKTGGLGLIWRCSQCKKCVDEQLELLVTSLSEADQRSLLKETE